MTRDPEPSLWISQIKQGKHFVGHMVADYDAKGAREYVLKTPVVAAAEELLLACEALQREARGRNCGFKFVDALLARLEVK